VYCNAGLQFVDTKNHVIRTTDMCFSEVRPLLGSRVGYLGHVAVTGLQLLKGLTATVVL
jgi:hypothetical protein